MLNVENKEEISIIQHTMINMHSSSIFGYIVPSSFIKKHVKSRFHIHILLFSFAYYYNTYFPIVGNWKSPLRIHVALRQPKNLMCNNLEQWRFLVSTPLKSLQVIIPVLTRKKLDKLIINDLSQMHQRTEVTG